MKDFYYRRADLDILLKKLEDDVMKLMEMDLYATFESANVGILNFIGGKEFINGTYRIIYFTKYKDARGHERNREMPVAMFKLCEMPGCCGILISFTSFIQGEFRNKGLGTLLHKFRIKLAKQAGYKLLMCTDIENNLPQSKILSKFGWQNIYNFKNPRTMNNINISVLDLDTVEDESEK